MYSVTLLMAINQVNSCEVNTKCEQYCNMHLHFQLRATGETFAGGIGSELPRGSIKRIYTCIVNCVV